MDSSELTSSLRVAISSLHKELRRQMKSVNVYSMTELETIGLLHKHNSLSPTELANATRIKTQSMSQILKKMEAQGVIRRISSDDDKRKTFISLTQTGKKMVEKTKYDRDEWLRARIKKRLSEKERKILEKTLPVLNKLMENKE